MSSGTGHTDSMPASGSRMMPLTNDDIAELGVPGRTATVGTRHTTPSMKPRREYSVTRCSAIAFAAPYDDCGRSVMSSGTIAGSGPPNTAVVLENTKRGGRVSRAARLEQAAGAVEVDPHAEVELGL